MQSGPRLLAIKSFVSRIWPMFLLVAGLLAFLSTLWHRSPYIDDCWFGEQAYYWLKDGTVRTPSIQAGLGWDQHLWVYHKLNIWLGAAAIACFGWSVYALKAITLLFYFLFFVVFIRFFRQQAHAGTLLTVALALFLTHPLPAFFAFTFRPEIAVMFFGFVSFSMLMPSSPQKISIGKASFVAGLMAGAAFLTHMNGIIFVTAGLALLLFERKYSCLPLFVAGSALTGMLFFIDMHSLHDIRCWLGQINHWPDEIAGNYTHHGSRLMSIFRKLGDEQMRFFWSPRVIPFSVLFFFALISNFRYLWHTQKSLLVYTLSLILSLNLFGSQIAERYLLYYLPMLVIIVALAYSRRAGAPSPRWMAIFGLLVLFQLFVLVKQTVNIVQTNKPPAQIHAEIAACIPKGTHKILAPYPFIFNELGQYDLLTYHSLEYFETVNHLKLTGQQALQRCHDLGADCILVYEDVWSDPERNRWFAPALDGQNALYQKVAERQGWIILQSK